MKIKQNKNVDLFVCICVPTHVVSNQRYHLVLVILWNDEKRTKEGRQVALWLGNESKFYMKKVETFITP